MSEKPSFSGAELKVQSATKAGSTVAAIGTLVMFGLSKTSFFQKLPDGVSGAIFTILTLFLTAVATFYGGWRAKHTHRPELLAPADPVTGITSGVGEIATGVTDGANELVDGVVVGTSNAVGSVFGGLLKGVIDVGAGVVSKMGKKNKN